MDHGLLNPYQRRHVATHLKLLLEDVAPLVTPLVAAPRDRLLVLSDLAARPEAS